jgi:hypothetical protein
VGFVPNDGASGWGKNPNGLESGAGYTPIVVAQ